MSADEDVRRIAERAGVDYDEAEEILDGFRAAVERAEAEEA